MADRRSRCAAGSEWPCARWRDGCAGFARNCAVRADSVFDDEGLTQRIAKALRGEPRHAVGVAAGRIGHQDTDRPLWPFLSLRAGSERQGRDGKQSGHEHSPRGNESGHGAFP